MTHIPNLGNPACNNTAALVIDNSNQKTTLKLSKLSLNPRLTKEWRIGHNETKSTPINVNPGKC